MPFKGIEIANAGRVFENENCKYSIIKEKYNFENNYSTSVLINEVLQYFISEDELKELDDKCFELGVNLPDIINISLSKTCIEYSTTIFDIYVLNKFGIKVLYKKINDDMFFIVQKGK